jgi:hypothetical protein
MYLSRVAASHAGMSWRSQSNWRRATAILPTGDVADTPRYALHPDATLPDPQWALGGSVCFDLCIPALISTDENPTLTASRVLHGARIRIRRERGVKRICGHRLSAAGCLSTSSRSCSTPASESITLEITSSSSERRNSSLFICPK